MSKSPLHSVRMAAYRLVCLPLALNVIMTTVWMIFSGGIAGASVLLGGVVWLLPNIYFVYQVFSKIKPAQAIVRTFYRAELIKLVLSAGLFIAVIKYVPVNFLAFLAGFGLAQLGFWLAPFIDMRATQ